MTPEAKYLRAIIKKHFKPVPGQWGWTSIELSRNEHDAIRTVLIHAAAELETETSD